MVLSQGSLTIRPEYGISEWFGSAHFDHPRAASAELLKDMFPMLDASHKSCPPPSIRGESIAQLHNRVAAAVQTIIDRCDAEGIRAVVLCTHAAVVIALGRVLTGVMPENIDAEDFQAFTCGLSTYKRKLAGSVGEDLPRANDSTSQPPAVSRIGSEGHSAGKATMVSVNTWCT
jgi:transcription factor C subunit 7